MIAHSATAMARASPAGREKSSGATPTQSAARARKPMTGSESRRDAARSTRRCYGPCVKRRRGGPSRLSRAGGGEDRLKQHVAPGGQVGGPGVLDLVVADAALARHENHGGGGDTGEVHSVVGGAAHDVAMAEPQVLGGGAHARDEFGSELAGRKVD